MDVLSTGGVVGSVAVAGGASEETADVVSTGVEIAILSPVTHDALQSADETVDDTRVGRVAGQTATSGHSRVVDQSGSLSQELGDLTANVVGSNQSELVAFASAPLCCCPPGETISGNLSVCVLKRGNDQCPLPLSHRPHLCTVREMFHFRDDTTVHGCQCHDYRDCGVNPPTAGHAWCATRDACGQRVAGVGDHWDFCQFAGDPLHGVTPPTSDRDALSAFVPNSHVRRHVVAAASELANMAPSQASTVPDYGIVLHKDKLTSPVQCLLPRTASTTGECARLCVEHRAAMVGMQSDRVRDEPCVAFAFNPASRFCVLLPQSAVGAAFHPFIHSWSDRQGWVHLILRYHAPGACPFSVMSQLRSSRSVDVVHDGLDGHLTLRRLDCPVGSANQLTTGSCRTVDCHGNTFCFVKRNCASRFGIGEILHGWCYPRTLPPC
mmetsp:Transcript_911/g.2212  ORF Transcript_911/g.2212 Transcript_911/m.2212 type:complete len:438 (+) Transcript_911:597-1910(+)